MKTFVANLEIVGSTKTEKAFVKILEKLVEQLEEMGAIVSADVVDLEQIDDDETIIPLEEDETDVDYGDE